MLKPLSEIEIQNIVKTAIDDAVSFTESEIMPKRLAAQNYYDGKCDLTHEEGRSKVVATKVRDVIRSIKPSLMRIFLSNSKPVEFIPKGPEDVASADQATSFINWAFRENDGYKVLNSVFHDALVKKIGVVKVYWDETEVTEIHTAENLSDEQFMMLVADDDIEVIEHEETTEVEVDPMSGQQVPITTHSVKVSRTVTEGRLEFKAVPPEDFFVDENATCIDDAYIVLHRCEMRAADVAAMGYDIETVLKHAGTDKDSTMSDAEDEARRGHVTTDDDDSQDPSMRLVMVSEAYMRLDIEGTGKPVLYKIIAIGGENEVMDYEVWDTPGFAVFECDPEPHAFYGNSVAELIMEDQNTCTAMLRGILDNAALTNNPRMEVVANNVNMDDVLNNEIGAIMRSKQIGSVAPVTVPFIAGAIMPMLEYMDNMVEGKTGVSKMSMGLDPDALQNTTATAANLTAQRGSLQVEQIARNIAESGVKQMFKLMLKLLNEHAPREQIMRLNGDFVQVDPESWNVSMDLCVNVGLGTGQDDMKLATLNQTFATQSQIWAQYGSMNGLVSMTNMRNTLADILAIGGYHNSERYYQNMNPELERQLLQQMQQMQAQQQQQSDPNQAFLQAEQMKAQMKAQSDMAKIQATMQGDQMKLQQKHANDMAKLQMQMQQVALSDDRERDRMYQDLMIEATRLMTEYGKAIDIANIQQVQQAERDEYGNLQ